MVAECSPMQGKRMVPPTRAKALLVVALLNLIQQCGDDDGDQLASFLAADANLLELRLALGIDSEGGKTPPEQTSSADP